MGFQQAMYERFHKAARLRRSELLELKSRQPVSIALHRHEGVYIYGILS